MRRSTIVKPAWIIYLGIFLLPILFGNVNAQEVEKTAVRLKLDYFKVMDGQSFLDIKAIARIDGQMTDVPDISLEVYYEFEEEEYPLGTAKTNMNGKSRFLLPSLKEIKADSSNTYILGIGFNGNELYKRASKTVEFKDAKIATALFTKDSINYIKATLTDVSLKAPIAEQSLRVQVKRLINPLRIGEEFNYTDEDGTVIVPVEYGIPGIDGKLTLEVVYPDSDEYGTVKAIVEAPYGVPVIKDTTFNERTLWGPRGKTPYFILIFTIFLIVATWGPIIYLIRNLYKISKS
jgi:hypothetical protein